MEKTDHAHDPKTCDDPSDGELPPIEDITYSPLREEISVEGRTLQNPEEWTLNTNGSRRRGSSQPMLPDTVDNSQGTRSMPASRQRYKQSSNDPQTVR